MNYYSFNIGDFNRATRHLTVVERAFYRELLDLYYDTEKAIPGDDFDRLAKRVCARTDEEKRILQEILNEFFEQIDGKYYHSRCEAEILIYKEKQEKASNAGKASALARAKGKKIKRSTDVKQALDSGSTPNPIPNPNNQKIKTLSGKPDAIKVLEFLNQKTGRRYQPVDVNLEMISARIKDGATVEECFQVIAKKCREWAADEKMNEYLRPATLFNRTKFAQYQGELMKPEN